MLTYILITWSGATDYLGSVAYGWLVGLDPLTQFFILFQFILAT